MKRALLFTAFVFTLFPIFGQNWHPINDSEVFNFRLDQSDVISASIWVDSIAGNGSDSTFYLNRIVKRLDNCSTLVGASVCDTCCWTANGWNFLQREMQLDANGTARFEDPGVLVLETQAALGDTFIFDSTASISATVTMLDTGRVFGQLDSLKTYLLSNGDSVVLSRSYGLIHFPGTGTGFGLTGIEGRNLGELTPGFSEVFDYRVGDLFETKYYDANGGTPYELQIFLFRVKYSVDSVKVQGDTLEAYCSGVSRSEHTFGYSGAIIGQNPNFQDTIIVIDSVNHFARRHVGELVKVNSKLHDNFSLPQPFFPQFYNSALYDLVTFSRDAQGNLVKSLANHPSGVTMEFISPTSDILVQGFYSYITAQMDYTEGLGVSRHDWFNFESWGDFELIAHAKFEGDTVGTFTDDAILLSNDPSVPELSARLYPNPAQNQFTLDFGSTQTGHAQLWDLSGRLVSEKTIHGSLLTWEVSTLPVGLYLLKLQTEEGVLNSKIQIAR